MFAIDILRRIGMCKTILLFLVTVFVKSAPRNGDLYLWIDEQQVKMFSGEYDFHFIPEVTNRINIHIT
jgi:hypothetical protein